MSGIILRTLFEPIQVFLSYKAGTAFRRSKKKKKMRPREAKLSMVLITSKFWSHIYIHNVVPGSELLSIILDCVSFQ